MSDLLVISTVGLGTFAMRAAFLVRRGRSVRERTNPVLSLGGPAVLAGRMLPALLAPRGTVSLQETAASLAAGAVCFAVWRRTRGFPQALLGGLVAWWLVLALIPGS